MARALRPEEVEALAAAGVTPGPGGFDAATLLAAAEAWGLAASVGEGPERHHGGGSPHYRAEVVGGGQEAARGRGVTEADALARALLKWRRRHA